MLFVWEYVLSFGILSFEDIEDQTLDILDVSAIVFEVSWPLLITEACECVGSVVFRNIGNALVV